MLRTPKPAGVRWATRMYGLLLQGLPRSFRHAFGREMILDAEALFERRWMRGGAWGLSGALLGAGWDLASRIARERIRGLIRRRGTEQLGRGVLRAPERPFEDGSGALLQGPGWGERMTNVIRGLRLAVRSLLRKPGFATVAITTLGLGIGSVVAIFSMVNAILLKPLDYPDPDRIVQIGHHAPGIDLPVLNNSFGTLQLYWENGTFFTALAAVDGQRRVLTGLDRPDQVEVLAATPEIFTVLGVQPALGRPFGEADSAEGAPAVAILLYDEWRNRFGGDPDILGSTFELDGVSIEVVGIMPAGFEFVQPGPIGLVPLTVPAEATFGTFGMDGLARLAPGITLEAARAQVEALQPRLIEMFDITQDFLDGLGWSVSVTTLREELVGDVASTLWLVLGTVGFVLLIACANVANLFLVRAEGRQKEIAIRAAMGAGRSHVAGSFLSESLVLGVLGGLLGVVVAAGGVSMLVTHGPQNVPRLHEVALTPGVLAFAALLSVGTGLLLGLLPMARYSARAFAGVLRDGGRGSTTSRHRNRVRSALVASQLALALVLLVGSGLMFRSFGELRGIDTGFEAEGVLTVAISAGDGMELADAARFYQDVAARVGGMPGVEHVGVTTHVPLAPGNANGGSFHIESRPRQEEELPPVAMYRAVSPGYFAAMGIPILQGRDMVESDLDDQVARVWVDETFSRTHFDGKPLGERVTWDGDGEEGEQGWAEIVGVVGNVRQLDLREEPGPNAYFPLLAGDLGYPSLAVGFLTVSVARGQDPADLTPAIRETVARLNGQVPVTRVRTMDEVVAAAMAGESITLVLLGIAAGMALFLGSIGLFGVISYVVSQRTREIGVRIALGARSNEVSGMVLRQGLVVAVAGVTLGLAGAFGLTRLMRSLLYEVSATDPLTFVLAPVMLLAVSALATWLPARRASRVDPMESLRNE